MTMPHGGEKKPSQSPGSKLQDCEHIMSGLYALANNECASSSVSSSSLVLVEANASGKLNTWAQSLGKQLHCTSSRLRIKITEEAVVYYLTSKYRVEKDSERHFAFVFPISGCRGAVTSLSSRINRKNIVGQLVQATHSSTGGLQGVKPATEISDGISSNKQHKRPFVIYSITPNASNVFNGKAPEVGTELLVETRWVTKEITCCRPHVLQLVYPFVCAPCLPEEITCRAFFSQPVKMVCSPNCRHGDGGMLNQKIHGTRCKVWLSPRAAAKTLRREDDAFFLTFYFQTPLNTESPIATFGFVILIVFLGIILWMMLTKDLLL